MKRMALLLFTFIGLLVFLTPVMAEELTLDQAIKLAMQNNFQLQAAGYDSSAAEWGYGRSFSAWLPHVSYNTTWTHPDDETVEQADEAYDFMRMFDPSTERSLYEDNYSSSIRVVQPLFNGGAEYVAIRAASINRRNVRLTEEDVRLQVMMEVKKAYYGLQKGKALWRVTKESLALAKETLRFVQAQFEVGQVDKSYVLRWEAEVAGAEGAVAESENIYLQAMMNLARILGQPISDRFEVPDLAEKVDLADLGLAQQAMEAGTEVPMLVESHPSLRAVNTAVEMAETENLGSYGSLLPNVNFSYTYNWRTNDTVMPDDETSWTLGISVEIPLFQGLGAVTGIGQTHRQEQSARMQVENFRHVFFQRAHAARLDLRAARLRVKAARKARQHTRANLQIVEQRSQLGMTTNLELLDAQLAYKRAQFDLISAVGDFYIALAEWEYLVESGAQDN